MEATLNPTDVSDQHLPEPSGVFTEADAAPVLERPTILRIYNYYRILIGFVLLLLFLQPRLVFLEWETQLVGSTDPELFQTAILAYVGFNILIGLASLFLRTEYLSQTAPSFVLLTLDLVCLNLLMYASGGVNSGLANFLIFTVAFGGGLIEGRVSTVLPAIAFILTLYGEIYLFFLEANTLQSFFHAGVLGIAFFLANILFQYLSRQLRFKEEEVVTLGQINNLIIERMKFGIVVANEGGDILLINDAAVQFLATPMFRGLENRRLPYTLSDCLAQWKADPARPMIPFHTHDSGYELLATFSELTSDTGSDTLIFLEDSTEIQEQAQQLKLAAVGRLSASIAHEIRNPLGAISHAAQLLGESQNLDKGDQRLTEIIQNHTVRLNGVVENVLQLSRRKTAEPQEVALRDWLDQFVRDFEASIGEPVDIKIDVDQETTVDIDPMHLSQVLNNLCQNGIRYSQKNTGENKLELAYGVESVSGNGYLDVTDFGAGIRADLIPNLFEPFYTTEATGTGLGLYLSRELCEANHARLSYLKGRTDGACFRISFLG